MGTDGDGWGWCRPGVWHVRVMAPRVRPSRLTPCQMRVIMTTGTIMEQRMNEDGFNMKLSECISMEGMQGKSTGDKYTE